MEKRILVTGATGQIGSELLFTLREKYNCKNIIALGHRRKPTKLCKEAGPYHSADIRNKAKLNKIIKKHKITTIYHLAAILSARGEEEPSLTWDININGLKNILDLAVEYKIQVFWPSSIAVFGPKTPKNKTPQHTILDPSTIYGITKLTGEQLCTYYNKKYKLDVRSLRFPGIISYKTPPGQGTTDYAVEMFYKALQHKKYTCFVKKETTLPMIYMEDAIRAMINLMEAKKLKLKNSYNLSGLSFSAEKLAKEIKKHIPSFVIKYKPDKRQKIADTWPKTIDDSLARKEWDWKPIFDLSKMTEVMLENLKIKLDLEK